MSFQTPTSTKQLFCSSFSTATLGVLFPTVRADVSQKLPAIIPPLMGVPLRFSFPPTPLSLSLPTRASSCSCPTPAALGFWRALRRWSGVPSGGGAAHLPPLKPAAALHPPNRASTALVVLPASPRRRPSFTSPEAGGSGALKPTAAAAPCPPPEPVVDLPIYTPPTSPSRSGEVTPPTPLPPASVFPLIHLEEQV